MTKRCAVVVCPTDASPERRVLGLSVGERLLLTLAKAKFTHVAFVGAGRRPVSMRNPLQEVSVSDLANGDRIWTVVADTVVDPALFETADLPTDCPLRRLTSEEISAVAAGADDFANSVGRGRAESGKGYAVRLLDDGAAREAADALMRSLVKQADGVISRHLNRKISTFISRRLASLPITPNMVTAVVFLIGVLSGPLAYLGTPLGFALGGFCYWFSAVLDGCDGELSRLKFLGSPLGAWLDTVVDDLVCLSYISGMYLTLARQADHPYWGYAGIGAVGFFLLTILPRYYVMAVRSGSGDYQKLAKETRTESPGMLSRILLGLRDFVFRTDFLPFAGMVTAVLGVPEVFAAPFAVGALASAVDAFVKLFNYHPEADAA